MSVQVFVRTWYNRPSGSNFLLTARPDVEVSPLSVYGNELIAGAALGYDHPA